MKPSSLTWESEDGLQGHLSVPQNGLYHFLFANTHTWGGGKFIAFTSFTLTGKELCRQSNFVEESS